MFSLSLCLSLLTKYITVFLKIIGFVFKRLSIRYTMEYETYGKIWNSALARCARAHLLRKKAVRKQCFWIVYISAPIIMHCIKLFHYRNARISVNVFFNLIHMEYEMIWIQFDFGSATYLAEIEKRIECVCVFFFPLKSFV